MGIKEADDMIAAYLERQKKNAEEGKERFAKPEVPKVTVEGLNKEMFRVEQDLRKLQEAATQLATLGLNAQQYNVEMAKLKQVHQHTAKRYVELREERDNLMEAENVQKSEEQK